mmetsp:Transcript_20823/g.60625  ORF Transcript_20823/g.60625 Transcript_20823/m.60625 type:complete len:83 (-) Transcript_20823:247-495(-)
MVMPCKRLCFVSPLYLFQKKIVIISNFSSKRKFPIWCQQRCAFDFYHLHANDTAKGDLSDLLHSSNHAHCSHCHIRMHLQME